MRLFLLFAALAALVVVPFMIWGGTLEEMFGSDAAVDRLRGFGPWAWAVGMLLLIGDLALPVPSTAVISALGFIYGPVLGGALGALGSFLSGQTAYWLCRSLGHGAAERIAGRDDLAKGEAVFASAGGWIVATSRWLPVFPEVIACMAGLARMPAPKFTAALACGSIPLGFVFGSIGAAGVERPVLALGLSAAAPIALWLLARQLVRGASEVSPPPASSSRSKTKR